MGDADSVQRALDTWGTNSVELHVPTFGELYLEHALAPFFVFQMFFVLLWCLDEYWMYSIVTGFMLVAMEALTVFRRLSIIRSLRGMVQKPGATFVMRNRKWVELQGEEIVPGDLIEVGEAKMKGEAMVPCDAILVAGSCVVNEATLTGENVALLKDNIDPRADEEVYNMKADRVHTLFGGTRLLQCSNNGQRVRTPNGGSAAIAIRTGFASSQGKVLRTIAFASEAMSANSVEAFVFILFLLSFAVAAAYYVLMHGLGDPDKSRYKLLLECIIILTSVVPPELPIELALAVNTSLMALRMLRIFCTEPFRIPFAGKLDICAFDKTGTLTRDDLLFRGVAASSGSVELAMPGNNAKAISDEALLVVAGCHSVARVDGSLVGDPLEVAAIQGLGWTVRTDHDIHHEKRRLRVDVMLRFHFNAALRRMTTVVLATVASKVGYRVCVKGAPESIRSLLRREDAELPLFEKAYEEYALAGFRVIALATRTIQAESPEALAQIPREDLEKDLEFAGFLVFECPIRQGTEDVLKELRAAAIHNIMITGDSELTACAVAKQTELCDKQKPLLVGTVTEESRVVRWSNNASSVDLSEARKTHTICLTGAALDVLKEKEQGRLCYAAVTVWARCSPTHKEQIMVELRKAGYHTLMCGDGTNDVGALKQSHVGVALVYVSPSDAAAAAAAPKAVVADPFVKRRDPASSSGTTNKKRAGDIVEAAKQPSLWERFLKAQEMQSKDLTMQMGDASIAAPFTVRASHVGPVLDILRQGRCTLVTTLQMYFILALNGLVTAFSLSVLNIAGVRYGDGQMTIMGLFTAAAFFFISRAKPLPHLAPQKPAAAIFTPYFICSLMGQFGIHLLCLLAANHSAVSSIEGGFVPPKPGAPFAPNVVNTCLFLVSSSLSLTTFAVNYRGHPFMQSLRENNALLKCLGAGYLVLVIGALGILTIPLQLSPLPSSLQAVVLGLMATDILGCLLWEKVSSLLFSKYSRVRV